MNKNEKLKDKIINNLESFSSGEKKIAKFVVDNYDDILSISSGELAKIVGVSGSTVVRFAKTLGYKGFLQFRNEIKKEDVSFRSPYNEMKSMPLYSNNDDVSAYFLTILKDVKDFSNIIDIETVEKIADGLLSADIVYLVGIGSDRIVADCLSNYLPLSGVRCITVCEEGLAMKEKMLMLTKNDFILMSSYPTLQSDEYWLVEFVKQIGAKLALITDSKVTAKSLGVEEYITSKGTMQTFNNSYVMSMVVCDILLLKLRQRAPARIEHALEKYDEITKK